MQKLPFYLSRDAHDWLSRLPEKEGEELGFVSSPRYAMTRGDEVIESFDREHYAFVHAKPAVWSDDRSALRFTVGERPFWLMPEILRSLEGRTLEVIRVDIGHVRHSGRFREFLVASPHEERA